MFDAVRLGDCTDHGGKAISASSNMRIDGRFVARQGDEVTCPEHSDVKPNLIVEECTKATVFAQEPLALLASGYLCALGSLDAANAIVTGNRPLESQVPPAGKEAIRYTTLSLIDDRFLADR